ncbi:MAG: hypothetical protein ACOWWO_10160 [Peptococcaceae bacterium]
MYKVEYIFSKSSKPNSPSRQLFNTLEELGTFLSRDLPEGAENVKVWKEVPVKINKTLEFTLEEGTKVIEFVKKI